MKITTWNVNGIRAALNKDVWDWVGVQNLDTICIQESKARLDQLTEEQTAKLQPYHIYWNAAEKPGYSGVVTLSLQEPLEVTYGIGFPEFDNEGRVVRTRYPGFILYNIYFPNGQRGQERVTYKLDFYARLLEICDRLHAAGEKIIICGDFNTSHREIDLRNPKQNATTSGFMPEERVWIDHYLSHGFVDVYRHLYPDRVQYTWWTYISNARSRGVGWRLDYYLISEALVPHVQDVIIHDEVLGSDHCPVTLIIND
jgi:exodeoxyribonuclease III